MVVDVVAHYPLYHSAAGLRSSKLREAPLQAARRLPDALAALPAA